ncbi:unnamed protein product [Mytilus coruscus]|uniref:Uncharacterized protein n=1 Tax=Mytilus coruscus TaxID=42192 RepID=A0A6J8E777_MYTCO|nr:unnamed protein product [Mytilus coruscus]
MDLKVIVVLLVVIVCIAAHHTTGYYDPPDSYYDTPDGLYDAPDTPDYPDYYYPRGFGRQSQRHISLTDETDQTDDIERNDRWRNNLSQIKYPIEIRMPESNIDSENTCGRTQLVTENDERDTVNDTNLSGNRSNPKTLVMVNLLQDRRRLEAGAFGCNLNNHLPDSLNMTK